MPSQVNTMENQVLPTVKVGTKHQIVIPSKIFSELGLVIGDFLAVMKKGNDIVLKPKKLIPKEDLWFHSKEWQEGEAEADRDIAEGNMVGPFNNIKDALKGLKETKI